MNIIPIARDPWLALALGHSIPVWCAILQMPLSKALFLSASCYHFISHFLLFSFSYSLLTCSLPFPLSFLPSSQSPLAKDAWGQDAGEQAGTPEYLVAQPQRSGQKKLAVEDTHHPENPCSITSAWMHSSETQKGTSKTEVEVHQACELQYIVK